MTLLDAVRMWPTPSASPYGSSQNGVNRDRPSAGTPSLFTIANREGGPLNPNWIEALMGFPVDWTDLGPQAAAMFNSNGSHRAQSSESQLALFG